MALFAARGPVYEVNCVWARESLDYTGVGISRGLRDTVEDEDDAVFGGWF